MSDNKPKKRKSQLVRKSAVVLGAVFCVVIALYLWAIFRPTGIERIRREQQELIASVPEREPVVLVVEKEVPQNTTLQKEYDGLIKELTGTPLSLEEGEQIDSFQLKSFTERFALNVLDSIHCFGSQLQDQGTVDLGVGFVDSISYGSMDNRLLLNQSVFIEGGSDYIAPEDFNVLIDRWEEALFLDQSSSTPSWQEKDLIGSRSLLSCGALVLLRTQYRGETDKVHQYLQRFFPYALSTCTSLKGKSMIDDVEENLMALLLLLNEMDPLDPGLLAELQVMTRKAMFRKEEVEARRIQSIQYMVSDFERRLENRKASFVFDSTYGDLGEVCFWGLDAVFSPLMDKNLEDFEKAMYEKSLDRVESAFNDLEGNNKILFALNRHKQMPFMTRSMVFDYFEDPENELPYELDDVSSFNLRLMMLEALIASIRYHQTESEWPGNIQELISEYLHDGFLEESRVKWEIDLAKKGDRSSPTFGVYHLVRVDGLWSMREWKESKKIPEEKLWKPFCQIDYVYLEPGAVLEKAVSLFLTKEELEAMPFVAESEEPTEEGVEDVVQ